MAETTSFTTPGYDYGVELGQIERKRALAQALQQQSMQETPQQTAGGWVVPTSQFQGAAKLAQAFAAKRGQDKADLKQKELTDKIQGDYRTMLTRGLTQLQGSPAQTIQPDPQEAQQSADQGTPQVGPVTHAAQAPDPMGALATFGSHPMGAQLAPLAMQEMQRQRLAAALGGGQPTAQANPMQGGPGASVMAPGGAQPTPQPQATGGPAGGLPMQAWLQIDPTGAKYMEQLAKDNQEANKPVVNRGFGLGRMVNGKYVPDQASLTQALEMESGKAGVHAPLEAPVTIKLSGGQEAQLSRPEYAAFQKTGDLPARYGQTQAQQGKPLPANVPEGDRAAYEAVASGKVSAAYRNRPAQASAALGTPGLSQPQSAQIEQAGQQRAAVEMGEGLGKRYNSIQDAGFSANQKMQKFERLGNLLSSIDTGKLTPAGTELSAWAKSAGIPIGDGVDNAQAAKALANEMALELRNPSGGAGMPGAMSDSDRNYLQSLIASIDKTPGANKLLLEGMTKLAERDREVAQLARDYKKKNGSFDDGFYDDLKKFSDSNPLFKGKSGSQMFAVNQATKERIVSTDGGNTWSPAK